MFCGCARSLHAALVESDLLLARRRFSEALAVSTQALSIRSAEADVTARFRIVRAHSLWMTGRVAVACGEARRAATESEEPLTRLEPTTRSRSLRGRAPSSRTRRPWPSRHGASTRLAPREAAWPGRCRRKPVFWPTGAHFEPSLLAHTRRVEAFAHVAAGTPRRCPGRPIGPAHPPGTLGRGAGRPRGGRAARPAGRRARGFPPEAGARSSWHAAKLDRPAGSSTRPASASSAGPRARGYWRRPAW